MISPESSFTNSTDNIITMPDAPIGIATVNHASVTDKEQRRISVIHKLGLLGPESIPVFDEAAQTAAHFLDAPICILSVIDRDRQHFKAAIGLSRIGLMNELAVSRQMLRAGSFCNSVVEQLQILAIEDATQQLEFQTNLLLTRYGIRAYLGVPVITSEGDCIGTLAVMEMAPRTFTQKDMAFLELIARWSISEFERNWVLTTSSQESFNGSSESNHPLNSPRPISQDREIDSVDIGVVKANLIAQMSQELHTPLTSIIGMTSVLTRGIYGSLTDKQKEYMEIVHHSSQYMHSLVNEIVELGNLNEAQHELDLSSVDVEMLCQQALTTLEQASRRREQKLHLTVEPGQRVWLLDKNKVRQLLYHIVFRVIQSSNASSTVRVHVSRKEDQLNISIWTSHPWLGEGLPHTEVYASAQDTSRLLVQGKAERLSPSIHPKRRERRQESSHRNSLASLHYGFTDDIPENKLSYLSANHSSTNYSSKNQASTGIEETSESIIPDDIENRDQARQNLGLLLSQKLANLHGGSISIQGTVEAGYRYVIVLPQLGPNELNGHGQDD